jgi:hypothetical protein
VDYTNTLREAKFLLHKMNMIRSYKHQLYSVTLNKRSLSCFDDKRYLLDDGIHSWAYGHYRISGASGEGCEGEGCEGEGCEGCAGEGCEGSL